MDKKVCVIGIDLGGTTIKYGLICKDGEFQTQGLLPSHANISAQAVIEQLVLAINELKAFAQANSISIKGIGIGSPGITDATDRIILGGAENIKGWENLPLADELENRVHLPVALSNDANMMGLGESIYGAGHGLTHVLFLTVGTGIGGAAIIDGKLFNGFDNRGTELGHVPLIANGEKCACGSYGCLEHYASTTALVRRFKELLTESGEEMTEEVNGKLIVRLYKQNHVVAVRSLEEHCNLLGHGIAGFINIFSPQRIVLGGGLSEAGEFYIELIREAAKKYSMADCAKNTEIVAADLGNNAGCLGAAALAFSLDK